jgi:flagellar biosynthesis/type III secretory pathway protein FliH
VVTGQLEEKEHSSLRILSDHAKEEDIQKFLTESEKLNTPGDRNNVDAVLQVSMAANRLAYEKVKEDMRMCEAMRELMKDEIEQEKKQARQQAKEEGHKEGLEEGLKEGHKEGLEEGHKEGLKEGLKRGKLEALFSLVRDGILTLSDAAKRADMTEALFAESMKHFSA